MEMEREEGVGDAALNAQIETVVVVQNKHRNTHLQTTKQTKYVLISSQNLKHIHHVFICSVLCSNQ
jgi:hypothetical protein